LSCGGKVEKLTPEQIRNSKIKISTHDQTLKLLKEGKSLKEIVKERDMVLGTILQHIEDLKKQGKLDLKEIKKFFDKDMVKKSKIIHKAFDEVGIEALKPAFEKLEGRYSYDDLKIARVLY
jgi:ATP-dependent DNA helicase RecQ